MIDNCRVCITIPAGRQRYMALLVPQLLREQGWDELQIWVNTDDPDDVAYLMQLPSLDKRIRLVQLPDGIKPDGSRTIYHFFRNCIDPNTVYIRFDDDIVYLEPGSIPNLVRFRINNEHPFLVFPVIINNAIVSHILQALGRIEFPQYVQAQCLDPVGWRSPKVAEGLHRLFLKSLADNTIERFKFRPRLIALNRMSINCICWLGKEFAKFGGELGSFEEEEWLSVVKPTQLGVPNVICGDVIVSHFAFYTQRSHLDETDILEGYRSIIEL